jgi:serine O-acetyltransferase
MKFLKEVNADLNAAKKFNLSKKVIIFLFNRGFHALLFYRMANGLSKLKIPIFPLVLTRFIQVLYAIDIHYRSRLSGGIVIVHGVGLVIGESVRIQPNVVLFHGVTLGRRGVGPVVSTNDGFPTIEEDCIICTGATILGKINIGRNTTIGANCVVTNDIPPDSIYKIPAEHFITYKK